MLAGIILLNNFSIAQQPAVVSYTWPGNKQATVSLSFDDARMSQVDAGTALLDQYGIKNTIVTLPWATHGFDYNFSGPGAQISTYSIEYFLKSVLKK